MFNVVSVVFYDGYILTVVFKHYVSYGIHCFVVYFLYYDSGWRVCVSEESFVVAARQQK